MRITAAGTLPHRDARRTDAPHSRQMLIASKWSTRIHLRLYLGTVMSFHQQRQWIKSALTSKLEGRKKERKFCEAALLQSEMFYYYLSFIQTFFSLVSLVLFLLLLFLLFFLLLSLFSFYFNDYIYLPLMGGSCLTGTRRRQTLHGYFYLVSPLILCFSASI